jgi:uncharacterized damage-inducible protein DinB
MTQGEQLLQELEIEAEVTRRYLALVPFDRAAFRPAEKSEKLGGLAIHLAEIIAWWTACIEEDKLDFIDFAPRDISTTEDLLVYFDTLLEKAKESLRQLQDQDLSKEWSMTYGDEILFTLPKKQVLRLFCMHHLIHHRAQLGVYLRILDIPLPAVYGPSADNDEVILIRPYS